MHESSSWRRNGGLLTSPSSRSFLAYRVLCRLLRFATRVFFRNIEVVGRESLPNPQNSAVIFCGNHPNSLLDPVLITAWCGRIVHFAAKAPLFSAPILGWLLRTMGAVPIHRRQDKSSKNQNNDDSFRDLEQVLLEGRAMGIFPEGISHDESQLPPLKTGAARMALGALARENKLRVFLVPVGLVYFTRHRFRSSVLIQFGDPIEIEAPEDATPDRVRHLTETLDVRLRGLTINAESWERIWVLDGVRRLYQPPSIDLNERARIARRLNDSYPKVADEPDVISLYDSVRDYLLRLTADNLDDALIARGLTFWQIALRVTAHFLLLFVSLPLFLVGAPIFLPIGLAIKIAGSMATPRSDTVATTKFLLGFLAMGALYIALTIWSFVAHGFWVGLLVGALLPMSGGAVIHVIARARALRHLFATTLRILTLRSEIHQLRAEREQLALRVAALVDKYRNAG